MASRIAAVLLLAVASLVAPMHAAIGLIREFLRVMAPHEYSRRNVGTVFFAKSKVVTSEIDSKRYFGRLWKSTFVIGVVKEVLTPQEVV
eukprot:IDg6625t1